MNKELIQKRNVLSKQYREYEDKVTEISKEIIRLQYIVDECRDIMHEIDNTIMAIDMCL